MTLRGSLDCNIVQEYSLGLYSYIPGSVPRAAGAMTPEISEEMTTQINEITVGNRGI